MAFLDLLKSKVLIDYEVRTKQAILNVKELDAAQQKQAKGAIESMKRQTDAAKLMVTQITAGLGLVVGGYALAKRGVEAYEKSLIAAGDSGNASLLKLKAATAQANAAFNQMEIALGQIVVAAAPVIQSLADMASGMANVAMGIGRIVSAASDLPGGGLVGRGVKNAWRLTPQGQLITGLDAAGGLLGPQGNFAADWLANIEASAFTRAARESEAEATPWAQPFRGRTLAEFNAGGPRATPGRRRRPGRGGGGGPSQAEINAQAWAALDLGATSGNTSGRYTDEDFAAIGLGPEEQAAYQGPSISSYADLARKQSEELSAAIAEMEAKQQESMLARIFGPIEEFDLYAAGFDTLKTASQAAFEAWITGSMGAGEAFKQAAIASLTAHATELLGVGLSSLGHGVVDLAMGNPKGAAELAAGGEAIAKAAAIGALARKLGGGGAAGAGAGGSAGATGGGRPVRESTRDMNVFIGDGFDDDGKRWIARRLNRAEQQRDRYYPGPDGGGAG